MPCVTLNRFTRRSVAYYRHRFTCDVAGSRHLLHRFLANTALLLVEYLLLRSFIYPLIQSDNIIFHPTTSLSEASIKRLKLTIDSPARTRIEILCNKACSNLLNDVTSTFLLTCPCSIANSILCISLAST